MIRTAPPPALTLALTLVLSLLGALTLALLAAPFGAPLAAETIVAGLSQNRVAITANFTGSEILIFGAVERTAPIPDDPLEVVITVQGPSAPLTVRRKARRYGVWVVVDQVGIDLAPSFYAVATTGPFRAALTATEDLRYKISVPQMIRSIGAPNTISDAPAFSKALIRLRQASGAYLLREGTVHLAEQTLFSTRIALPANLTEGTYSTRIFLTRNGRVVDALDTAIDVRKEGIERWLFNLAHSQPVLYGVLSLGIAIAAGWLASTVFRYIRS